MKIAINFGALAKPIRIQAREQGLSLGRLNVQKDADAITRLHLRGFITESVAHRARRKLMARITKEARSE